MMTLGEMDFLVGTEKGFQTVSFKQGKYFKTRFPIYFIHTKNKQKTITTRKSYFDTKCTTATLKASIASQFIICRYFGKYVAPLVYYNYNSFPHNYFPKRRGVLDSELWAKFFFLCKYALFVTIVDYVGG